MPRRRRGGGNREEFCCGAGGPRQGNDTCRRQMLLVVIVVHSEQTRSGSEWELVARQDGTSTAPPFTDLAILPSPIARRNSGFGITTVNQSISS